MNHHDRDSNYHHSEECVSIDTLIHLFYDDAGQLGIFERAAADSVPIAYQRLLNHTHHMTVTVERHHGDLVDVEVLRSETSGIHYQREILLRKQRDAKVVQYGIVRLNTLYLADAPRTEILEQRKPLGRVLIEHNVLREIELFDLFRIECGPVLASHLGVQPGSITYGRTALIYCDHDPAIELLEIVSPETD